MTERILKALVCLLLPIAFAAAGSVYCTGVLLLAAIVLADEPISPIAVLKDAVFDPQGDFNFGLFFNPVGGLPGFCVGLMFACYLAEQWKNTHLARMAKARTIIEREQWTNYDLQQAAEASSSAEYASYRRPPDF